MTVKRVLVGWDGSRDAREALRVSDDLAANLGADVVVLEVVHRPYATQPEGEDDRDLAARSRELDEAMAAHGGSGAARRSHRVIAADDPGRALCDYAAEHGFDLLVLGRRGLDHPIHPRCGRVTEHGVRHSPCPVLVAARD